ncbi:MAG: TIR domain-containing protein [Flavobacterium sp.]
MAQEIREYDFFLFISSKNSLKSESCHFELNVARSVYHESWKRMLIPIHIDNFLFEVNDCEIPLHNRKLFWNNIVELKELNSIDFSVENTYSDNNIDSKKLDKLISSIHAIFYSS